MHHIMQVLHEDHVNVARLLELMDLVFEQVRQGNTDELHLVHKAMRYMTAYPDIYHHPTEDVVFRKLVKKAPETSAVVDRLHHEHAVIGRAGGDLLTLVTEMLETPIAPDEVLTQGPEYIRQLQAHMNTEEGDVFPLINVILTPHDWEDVDIAVAGSGDPLFGAQVQRGYQDLAKSLTRRLGHT